MKNASAIRSYEPKEEVIAHFKVGDEDEPKPSSSRSFEGATELEARDYEPPDEVPEHFAGDEDEHKPTRSKGFEPAKEKEADRPLRQEPRPQHP